MGAVLVAAQIGPVGLRSSCGSGFDATPGPRAGPPGSPSPAGRADDRNSGAGTPGNPGSCRARPRSNTPPRPRPHRCDAPGTGGPPRRSPSGSKNTKGCPDWRHARASAAVRRLVGAQAGASEHVLDPNARLANHLDESRRISTVGGVPVDNRDVRRGREGQRKPAGGSIRASPLAMGSPVDGSG